MSVLNILKERNSSEELFNLEYQPLWNSEENTSCLAGCLDYLRLIVHNRMKFHFGHATEFEIPELSLHNDDSPFVRFLSQREMMWSELILLLFALQVHAYPDLFTDIFARFMPKGGDFPNIGGAKGTHQRGFIPTGETVLFVLAGMEPEARWHLRQQLFSQESPLIKDQILHVESLSREEGELSGRLILAKEYIELFLTGRHWQPGFSSDFPAKIINTAMEWDDLIVSPDTRHELDLIRHWLNYNDRLLIDRKLSKKLKPGCRALFYGPSGTGKTLTACLLGKALGIEVYRVDLSAVVSKYIGETEKNLEQLFNKAKNKNWILFFDEADALFGKRTNVSSAHDRFANQEVSYLLQRIEDHPGLVILASNYKNNIDQAFMRRFQFIVHFSMPDAVEREMLWKNTLPDTIPMDPEIDLTELARQYEMTGAGILNVTQLASLRALANNDGPIRKSYLIEEIRKEYLKEGKTL